MTFRAIKVLQSVDTILAEDTRTTGFLLKHFEITKPRLQSHHAFNEHKYSDQLIERLKNGEKMALVSDAGTPVVSDPGFLLVRKCLDEGLQIECLPGATAFVPALVKSGLPADRFTFEGFLPHKKGRQKKLTELAEEPRTMILYESPHRLLKALQQCAAIFGGDRRASVSRELTKMYEETQNGSLDELIAYFTDATIKGEIVIVIEGKK